MLSEADIVEALRACYDKPPQFQRAVNIVDLGLIESIALKLDPEAPGAGIPGVPPRQSLSVTLIPCSPDEEAQAQLGAQVRNRLAGLPELSAVSVRFADSPEWGVHRISREGRRVLSLDFPILNQPGPR
jgi:metal-sulfur cluster biosynthetic enzyme